MCGRHSPREFIEGMSFEYEPKFNDAAIRQRLK